MKIRNAIFVLFMVYIISACSALFPPDAFLATPTAQTSQPTQPAFCIQPTVQTYATIPPTSLLAETFYIEGSWQCHINPNDNLSTVLVYLHDGEGIEIIEKLPNDWLKIKAGKISCYVRSFSLEVK